MTNFPRGVLYSLLTETGMTPAPQLKVKVNYERTE